MTESENAADPRLARLETGPLKREADTIRAMIGIRCRGERHTKDGTLCNDCRALEAYALARLARCPFGEKKPVCAKCRVHCYKAEARAAVRAVMCYAGPRMLFRHPILALEHGWKSLTVEAPEKPRNPKAHQKEPE